MKMLKELKWEAILTGVLYILLGIVALVIPETMQKTLGYLIGIVLIVAGLVSISAICSGMPERTIITMSLYSVFSECVGSSSPVQGRDRHLPDSLYSGSTGSVQWMQ